MSAFDRTPPVFPDAYRRHRRPGDPGMLPRLRPWVAAVLAAAALWAALSWPVWRAARAPIEPQLERIEGMLEGTAAR